MAHLKLIVKEPTTGNFFWTLVETRDDGREGQELQASEEDFSSYEAALASGTLALNRHIARRDAAVDGAAKPG